MNKQESYPVTIPAGAASVLIRTDAEHGLTDAANNGIFGGDAAAGVARLIAAGAVAVNGAVLDGGEISINGAKALWKHEDGTWSWKTHILQHGENLSYEEASVGFVNGMSMLRGPSYTLSFADGKVVGIAFEICDVCFAETVTAGEEYTTITVCGAGDGSMNRTDPSTVRFANALVERDENGNMPEDQCIVLYWLDNAGWHLKRADSRRITLPADGEEILDTRINLEYSQPWNRPSQPVKAFGWMELDQADMIQWFYCRGITCGMSHVHGQAVLAAAIEKAEQALLDVAVSAAGDGSDVEDGRLWTTQERRDLFEQVVFAAKAVCAVDGSLNTRYEEALHGLCSAYGGDGSFYSRQFNVFSDGIGFMTFAKNG